MEKKTKEKKREETTPTKSKVAKNKLDCREGKEGRRRGVAGGQESNNART